MVRISAWYNGRVATRTPKIWTPTEYNGQPARLYEDGSIRNERGHMLRPIPGGSEASAAKRHEKRGGGHAEEPKPRVEEYGEGRIVRGDRGLFLPGSRTPKPITRENAHTFAQARKEKAASLLRARILEATSRHSDIKLTGSAAAVAEAGGILWEEIVLADAKKLREAGLPAVYARDRLDAWQKIGQAAGLLETKQADQRPSDATMTQAGELVLRLLTELRRAVRRDAEAGVVDAAVSEER